MQKSVMFENVVYTKSAVDDIKKLDRIVKKKIKKKIEACLKKPLFYARKLLDPKLGTYRWRVGNYRIVFDMDMERIVILRICHRREVYR